MTRMERYRETREAIVIENAIKPLQRQIDSMDEEIAELEYSIEILFDRIEELENKCNNSVEDVKVNGESICKDKCANITCCKADHRKQRGRTAPNCEDSIDEIITLLKLG